MGFFDDPTTPPYNTVDAALQAGYYGTGSTGGDGGDGYDPSGDGSGGGTYNDGVSSSGGINWNNVLDLGFGLGSQIVQANAHNPTQQIGGAGVVGIGGNYAPANVLQAGAAYNRGGVQYAAAPGASNLQGGIGVDNTLNSLTGIITRNPLLIGGIIVGILLWKSGRK